MFRFLNTCFFALILGAVAQPKSFADEKEGIRVEVLGPAVAYNLNLEKPDAPILHPNIKVITISEINGDNNSHDSELSFDTWTPSKVDLEMAQDVYIDQENLAAVRLAEDSETKQHVAVSGVVNGNKIEYGVVEESVNLNSDIRIDYIEVPRNITPYTGRSSTNNVPLVVEMLVVCDKELSDVFNQDRNRILDYLTVYFWDINLRYKTLPSSNISFRITGVVIINSPSGQPFIEQARAGDGRAEFGRILDRFNRWAYSQINRLPKFDNAILMTNTRLEWHGGLAYYRGACNANHGQERHYGTAVFNDGGDWGSLTVGAHEIGHNLGAPHDDDPNFPGGRCSERGHIMGGGNNDLRFFFSSCSDRTIRDFAYGSGGNCLRQLNERVQNPPISPDFSFLLAPSMTDQCRRRLRNPSASEEDTNNCKQLKCRVPANNGAVIYTLGAPVDNTPCRVGRCFRGRCRKTGRLLVNVASGQCARPQNPFAFSSPVQMYPCPNPTRGATPLDTFVFENSQSGVLLQNPWSSTNGRENGDRCVFTGNAEGNGLSTDRCNAGNAWHGWDMVNAGGNEFLLQHRVTKRCAKQEGSNIRTYSRCDSNDRSMRWRMG